MKRARWRGTVLFVTILTVLGVTAGLRLYGVGTETVASSVHAATVSSTAGSSSATATPTPSASASSSATDTSTPSATPTPTPSASTGATATKVVDGAVEDTRYGPVQVEVTFTGTKITAITAVQTPSGDGRSVQINQYAIPILTQEALSSQSASIDTVSGATYTSDGYTQSLQSAIDQR